MNIHCKYDELVSPRDLKDHPKNRNKHPKEQIERLAKLYEYHGIRHPIIVSRLSGHIVAGHGRKQAAVKAKVKEVPVVYQDFADETAEYAFIQADNAIALWSELDLSGINYDVPDLGPDFDIDFLGIKNFEIDPADKLDPQCDEDEVPEARPEPKVVRGEVYILGNHRLMCGDSTAITDVEKLMDGKKVDMVFTDPPYGVKEKTNRKSSGRGAIAENQDFRPVLGDENTDVAIESFNLVTTLESKTVIFWGANYYANSIPEVSSWIIWDKRNGVKSDDNADCEMAWCNNKKPARLFSHLWKGAIRSSEKNEKKVHPTQKPIVLAEWCFENYGNPSSVLDLFGGSGSTLIACEKTGRSSYLMELDPIYCGVILDRWQKFTGKKAHREDGVAWDEIKGE